MQIAEKGYKDALQDQDQQHACEKDTQEQKLNLANKVQIVEHKDEVVIFSATLKDLKEVKMKDIKEEYLNLEEIGV
jgi:hypothetical protein